MNFLYLLNAIQTRPEYFPGIPTVSSNQEVDSTTSLEKRIDRAATFLKRIAVNPLLHDGNLKKAVAEIAERLNGDTIRKADLLHETLVRHNQYFQTSKRTDNAPPSPVVLARWNEENMALSGRLLKVGEELSRNAEWMETEASKTAKIVERLCDFSHEDVHSADCVLGFLRTLIGTLRFQWAAVEDHLDDIWDTNKTWEVMSRRSSPATAGWWREQTGAALKIWKPLARQWGEQKDLQTKLTKVTNRLIMEQWRLKRSTHRDWADATEDGGGDRTPRAGSPVTPRAGSPSVHYNWHHTNSLGQKRFHPRQRKTIPEWLKTLWAQP